MTFYYFFRLKKITFLTFLLCHSKYSVSTELTIKSDLVLTKPIGKDEVQTWLM